MLSLWYMPWYTHLASPRSGAATKCRSSRHLIRDQNQRTGQHDSWCHLAVHSESTKSTSPGLDYFLYHQTIACQRAQALKSAKSVPLVAIVAVWEHVLVIFVIYSFWSHLLGGAFFSPQEGMYYHFRPFSSVLHIGSTLRKTLKFKPCMDKTYLG